MGRPVEGAARVGQLHGGGALLPLSRDGRGAGGDDIEGVARLALGDDLVALRKVLAAHLVAQLLQLRERERLEQLHLGEDLDDIRLRWAAATRAVGATGRELREGDRTGES
eukprot:7383751-Prymnesium_polylepis.2